MDSGGSVSLETYTFVCILFGVIAGLLGGGLIVALCVLWRLRLKLAMYQVWELHKKHVSRNDLYIKMSQENRISTKVLEDITSIKGLDALPKDKDRNRDKQQH